MCMHMHAYSNAVCIPTLYVYNPERLFFDMLWYDPMWYFCTKLYHTHPYTIFIDMSCSLAY